MIDLLFGVALAHPLGERFATQTTILEVHRDHLRVDYVAEVPHAVLRSASVTGDPVAAMAIELQSGLLLQVDGEVVSMTRRGPARPPVPTSEHTWGFELALEAPLPAGAEAIRVSTANLQDTQSYFAGDVRLADGLAIDSCSLLVVDDGEIVRDDTLRWRRDESARVLQVELAPPAPSWWRALSPSGVRHAGQALDDAWFGPPALLGLCAASAGLGAAAGRRVIRGAPLLALGLLPTLAPPSPLLWLALAVGLGALAIASARERSLLPWLVLASAAALVALTPLPRAALLVAAAGALGLSVRGAPPGRPPPAGPRRRPPRGTDDPRAGS